jgi:hypothetical protein
MSDKYIAEQVAAANAANFGEQRYEVRVTVQQTNTFVVFADDPDSANRKAVRLSKSGTQPAITGRERTTKVQVKKAKPGRWL